MITFKQTITVSDELVQGLAVFLGYQPTLTRDLPLDPEREVRTEIQTEEYPNPETAEEYVDRLAKDHTANFFKAFGDKLVQDELTKLGIDEQKEQSKKQLEDAVIKPVTEVLITEVTKSKKK